MRDKIIYQFKNSLKDVKAGKIKMKAESGKVRCKILRGKKVFLCDYHGDCKNKAYKEVYPGMLKKDKGADWSYLCRKHFKQERKFYKNKLPYSNLD
jgi:hypothetical protein